MQSLISALASGAAFDLYPQPLRTIIIGNRLEIGNALVQLQSMILQLMLDAGIFNDLNMQLHILDLNQFIQFFSTRHDVCVLR